MSRSRPVPQPPAWRLYVVCGLLLVLVAALVARIISLQIIDTERGYRFLQEQGNARSLRTVTIPARRGMLLDRNGEPLAVSTPVYSLWCNPRLVDPADVRLGELAQVLSIPVDQLRAKVQKGRAEGRGFLYLSRRQPPAVSDAALALEVPGVDVEQEFKRYYPAGEVAAHLVGFTNIDETGQEGLELAYENHLRAQHGSKQIVKDLLGRTIGEIRQLKPAVPGRDIRLSIDLRIQYAAHLALKEAVRAAEADAGSMVLLDVQSGEVLAVTNYPAYNPNNRAHMKPASMRNRALTDLFEPGSTVKPLTVAAALETGRYHPDTIIDTNPGYIRVGRKTIPDHHNYGVLTLAQVLAKSSQVGVTRIAMDLDPNQIRQRFYTMGLGQAPGTGFPGEAVGLLPEHRKWRDIERATFAYGYGLTVTPLQLAQAYQVLAAGGVMHPVSFLRQQKPAATRVMDQAIADQILAMLALVSQPGGTAAKAVIPAFSFGGKTGTVHKVGVGGYQDKRYMSIFAGMAPAVNPRVAGVVVIDDPRGGKYFGGAVAAPVFSAVIGQALPVLNVEPDKLQDFASLPAVARPGGQS